jgi:aldose 1-epimerase
VNPEERVPTSVRLLDEPTAHRLAAGELEAVFLPAHGMLGASLRHRGAELLRRVDDLDAAAAKGSTAGIPILHPWANRLARPEYRAAGKAVRLDLASPLVHVDGNRLPIHGVPWSMLEWSVMSAGPDTLAAGLDWSRADLLAIFPFPHRLEIAAALTPESLTIETSLIAGREGPVPASFGFHPYFGIPGLPRDQWRLTLPAMQRLVLDPKAIPTGRAEPFEAFDAPLGARTFDDGYGIDGEEASFSLSGAGRRIAVEWLTGYRYAQVFAPSGIDCVAIEPMTSPTNALITGRGLQMVDAGGRFKAAFRIRVDTIA